jgi:hypothetical protein
MVQAPPSYALIIGLIIALFPVNCKGFFTGTAAKAMPVQQRRPKQGAARADTSSRRRVSVKDRGIKKKFQKKKNKA